MKKILLSLFLITAMLALSYTSKSQATFSHTTSNPTGTITNTGIDTMSYTLTKGYDRIAIQPVITRTSGTLAGTSILAYSVNGSAWVNSDTLTLANAATSVPTIWNKTVTARYWRIITTGSGTMVATTAAKLQTD
jgi:hypothetical protein